MSLRSAGAWRTTYEKAGPHGLPLARLAVGHGHEQLPLRLVLALAPIELPHGPVLRPDVEGLGGHVEHVGQVEALRGGRGRPAAEGLVQRVLAVERVHVRGARVARVHLARQLRHLGGDVERAGRVVGAEVVEHALALLRHLHREGLVVLGRRLEHVGAGVGHAHREAAGGGRGGAAAGERAHAEDEVDRLLQVGVEVGGQVVHELGVPADLVRLARGRVVDDVQLRVRVLGAVRPEGVDVAEELAPSACR